MYKKYVKRQLDILFSLLLVVLTSPIMIVTAILIKLFDRGPILFIQLRTGLNGKSFKIYKFRTMTVKTHNKHGFELKHKERLTKIGQVLRKTSIDELPQIFNILKGDMSFIGPRPWIPEYYNTFTQRQKRRVKVLPGITGLAQAKGRNGLTILEKLEYDMEYVDNISFKRDVKVLLMTILIVLTRHNAEIVQEGIQNEIFFLRTTNTFEDDNVDMDILDAILTQDESTEDSKKDEKSENKVKPELELKMEAKLPTNALNRNEEVTIITKGTTITGSISSDGSLEVNGTIKGDIECQGKLSIIGIVSGNCMAAEVYVGAKRLVGCINSEGSVKIGLGTVVIGDVTASSGVIAGAIKGEIDINGPIVIDSSAVIKGNIKAQSIQINNGAVIEGFCSLSYSSIDIDNIFE